VRGIRLLCGFNESLFEDLAAAIRTPCRLTQDELVWPTLASHFRSQPVERDLRILGLTVLAKDDLSLGPAKSVRTDRNQLYLL
jgi:hypothetical protein